MKEYFGTENIGGKSSRTIAQRLGRCYELAGYALSLGSAPQDALLIHGTIHHLRAPRRIGHAWLVMGDGDQIWEPVSASFWPMIGWNAILRSEAYQRYRPQHVRALTVQYRTWGPWHDLVGFQQVPGTVDIDASGI